MRNAMLRGGHSYEYAMECVRAAYGDDIAEAKERFEKALVEWRSFNESMQSKCDEELQQRISSWNKNSRPDGDAKFSSVTICAGVALVIAVMAYGAVALF